MKADKNSSFSIVPGKHTTVRGSKATRSSIRGSVKPGTTKQPNPKYIPPASVKKSDS